MGQLGLIDPRRRGQGARHQLLTDPHAPAAGDQLVEHETLDRGQPIPCAQDEDTPRRVIGPIQRAQISDPAAQRCFDPVGRRGQDQRDGLGQIAHHRVAGLEQPRRDARRLCCPKAQLGGGDAAPWPASRQKRHGPQPVIVGGSAEIIRHFSDLEVGARRLIQRCDQRGEILHRAAFCCKKAPKAAKATGGRPVATKRPWAAMISSRAAGHGWAGASL